MRRETLDFLRCPFCGGRLSVAESEYHHAPSDEILDAVLGCYCCAYPVVAGIPVLHLDPPVGIAQQQVQAGRPDLALRTMLGLEDAARIAQFDEFVAAQGGTYREAVAILSPDLEGTYFLYRFSDPTYLVAQAVVRAVAGVLLARGGRAVDICGGSGHLTVALTPLSTSAPVLADLHFWKLWLARRFTAPRAEVVCCNANAPLPFARETFNLAICSDAFQYIWTKRQMAGEMQRLVGDEGAVVITHAHNAEQWNPAQGNPLPPEGYLGLFDQLEPRLFGESRLFEEVVERQVVDLARRQPIEELAGEHALTLVATRRSEVFATHAVEAPRAAHGEYRLNPLYQVEVRGDELALHLQFPSEDYAEEFGACRRYLPEDLVIPRDALTSLAGGDPARLADLVRRRVLLDLPKHYC